jgi:hypothetical protein
VNYHNLVTVTGVAQVEVLRQFIAIYVEQKLGRKLTRRLHAVPGVQEQEVLFLLDTLASHTRPPVSQRPQALASAKKARPRA